MSFAKGVLVLSLVLSAVPSWAQERVHSDLPLFSGQHGELQPQNFTDKGSFGCSSRIAFGDWKYLDQPKEREPEVEWLRLVNYGVIHCAAIEAWSHDREHLGRRGIKYSWFVQLGTVERANSTVELWALQSGARPGSDYLLLARAPGPGLIKNFEVLPVACPKRYERKGNGPDIWRSDYCAINTAEELRSFARQMAQRPTVGTLTFVAQAPAGETE